MKILYKSCGKCGGDIPYVIVKSRSVGATFLTFAAFESQYDKNIRRSFPTFSANRDIKYDCTCKAK